MLDKKLKDVIAKKIYYVEAQDNSKKEGRLIGFHLENDGYLRCLIDTKENTFYVDVINVSMDEEYIDERLKVIKPSNEAAKKISEKANKEIDELKKEEEELIKPLRDKMFKIQKKANEEIRKHRIIVVGKTFVEMMLKAIKPSKVIKPSNENEAVKKILEKASRDIDEIKDELKKEEEEVVKPLRDEMFKIQEKANDEISEHRTVIAGKTFVETMLKK
jgi:F0F1-type ATP synthase membrane subunit b/b'